MRWHARFQAAFFNAWERAGLPAPQHYEAQYLQQLQAHRFAGELPAGNAATGHPLNRETVDAVFGFGALFGHICMQLLGSPAAAQARRRVAWCGHFNLGISLFDYLCDVSGEAGRAAALPALQRLLPKLQRTSPGVLPEVEPARFLNQLIESLLVELASAHAAGGSPDQSSSLLRALRSMYAAELKVAGVRLGPVTPEPGIERALRLKSEEPFRVMCQWATANQQSADRAKLAPTLGRALGRCFWLADDAKDLWSDLDAGQWNIFALRAAQIDPTLLQTQRNPLIDSRLASLLERERIAERASVLAVKRLLSAIAQLPASKKTQRDSLGLVAAALARW